MSKVDPAKRRRVMQRSMDLGHCICDPRRACPCQVFQSQGICPCAGERPEPVPADQVKLTERVHNAGCASKIAPADLEGVLARLPAVADPAVLCGVPAGDDAGIYRLSDGACLVQSVDVMTPCVDDARSFGRICAANCLSDIYAMGGRPRTALSILAFPAETLDGQVMYEMMTGAMEVLEEADVALIGGHSIKDDEIKLGFAITGTIDADKAVAHGSAAVGDLLVLTKPLGVGVLSFSRQIGRDHAEGLAAAQDAMAGLNKPAAEAMNEVGVSACTDVTGFGLFGHLIGMARHSGVTAQVWAEDLPAFPGALEALRDGVIPGAVERNTEYVGPDLSVADGVDEARVNLGFDAQTSGGLLIAVPADRHGGLLAALASRNVTGTTVGRIVAESDGHIEIVARAPGESRTSNKSNRQTEEIQAMSQQKPPEEPAVDAQAEQTHAPGCCTDVFGETPAVAAPAETTSPGALQAFGSLMRATSAEGAIDAKTKELIVFALSVLSRCGPCVSAHLDHALKMGITREQLDEAAWCAIAMGGAPIKMFYQEALRGAGGCCC